MKPKKGQDGKLAESLSQRVGQLRERLNMTVLDLAKHCRFSIEKIERIESGMDVWLSVTDRTILARALRVLPAVLQEVEADPSQIIDSLKEENRTAHDLEGMAAKILAGKKNIECPDCAATLKSSIEDAFDFEGNLVRLAHAYCPVCPFVLR